MKPYKDSKGNWTAGIGHLITDDDPGVDDPKWRNRTFIMCEFVTDSFRAVSDARAWLGRKFFDELPDDPKIAVCDLSFNQGRAELDDWGKLRAALTLQDWDMAIAELKDSEWWGEVKQRGPDLAELFRKCKNNEQK